MAKVSIGPLHEYTSLVDILGTAARSHGARRAFGLLDDSGAQTWWTFAELDERSRAVARRLRSDHGLSHGDRLMTWSPSTPELPAVFFGAMRAGVTLVPLDVRMTRETVARIAADAGASLVALGDGVEPLDRLGVAVTSIRDLTAPGAWAEASETWVAPTRADLFEIIYTSGTTGAPKGVMLSHGNVLAWLEGAVRAIEPREHRVVSVIPLSHIFGQIAELFYAMLVGAEVLYVRSLSPKTIFRALRDHRVTTMATFPLALEVFWKTIEREVRKSGQERAFTRMRALARHLPFAVRRLLFARVHRELGGELRLFISAGAPLPAALQRAWEDLGVNVFQGYGATECGIATCTREDDRGGGTVGVKIPPNELRIADDGEILVRGRGVFQGYWRNEAATRAAFDSDGFYGTGDLGERRADGQIVLRGRKKEMIVLPNGLKVFPADIEGALIDAGVGEVVVLETAPGRIEAVVPRPTGGALEDARTAVDAAVRTANARLGVHQRVDAWRFWPEEQFPRTHTLKVQRAAVRERILLESASATTAGV